MRKFTITVTTIIVLCFAFLVIQKRQVPGAGEASIAGTEEIDERRRVQRFWETYRQATRYRMAGQLELAAAAYEEALEADALHEDALYYLGNVYLDLEKPRYAETAWHRLSQTNATSSRAHSQLGNLYFCVGDPLFFDVVRAQEAYGQAFDINKEETGSLLRMGQIALVREHFDEALSRLEAVIGSNHMSVEAHFKHGYLAWKRGDFERAERSLRESLLLMQGEGLSDGIAGEGDTKEGSALLSRSPYCSIFEEHIYGLREVADVQDLSDEMRVRYHALESTLEDVRQLR